MGIKPVGAACASAKCTEHRTVRAKKDDDKAEAAETVRRSVIQPASAVSENEAQSRLVPGDLDDQKARPECYVITNGPSDKDNGLLSLTSPLALALSDASPGDEVTIQLGDRERPVL